MNGDGFGRMDDPVVLKKAKSARFALYGFFSCLAGAVCLLSLNVPLVIAGEFAGESRGGVIDGLLAAANACGGFLFFGTFASFAFLIFTLVRPPRGIDVRPLLQPSLRGLAVIFAAGADFFVLVIMGSLGIFLAGLYLSGRNPVFAALTVMCGAVAFFAVSVTSALVSEFRRGEGGIAWMRRQSRDTGTEQSPGQPARSGVKRGGPLSLIEKLLSAALSVTLLLVFQFDSVQETLGRLVGRVAGKAPSPATLLYWLVALFILFFSMIFALKALRTLRSAFRPAGVKRL